MSPTECNRHFCAGSGLQQFISREVFAMQLRSCWPRLYLPGQHFQAIACSCSAPLPLLQKVWKLGSGSEGDIRRMSNYSSVACSDLRSLP